MADFWYYAHDESKTGPYSARQLRELAVCGQLLPTDTVWKEGVERGVLASKVKNLFAPAEASSTAQPTSSAAAHDSLPAAAQSEVLSSDTEAETVPTKSRAEAVPEEPAAPSSSAPVSPPGWQQNQGRKGTATAGPGAVIVGQDGFNVKYRKQCTACGHADSSWHTMPIRTGLTRASFYCPKCRKNRNVEIRGSVN